MTYPNDARARLIKPRATIRSVVEQFRLIEQFCGGDRVISNVILNGRTYSIHETPKITVIRKGRGRKSTFNISIEWVETAPKVSLLSRHKWIRKIFTSWRNWIRPVLVFLVFIAAGLLSAPWKEPSSRAASGIFLIALLLILLIMEYRRTRR